jgi:hypothetical protein
MNLLRNYNFLGIPMILLWIYYETMTSYDFLGFYYEFNRKLWFPMNSYDSIRNLLGNYDFLRIHMILLRI